MTVEAIKQAISALPEKERHSLASWLVQLDFDDWDRQMVQDFSPGGRGAELARWVKRVDEGVDSSPGGLPHSLK